MESREQNCPAVRPIVVVPPSAEKREGAGLYNGEEEAGVTEVCGPYIPDNWTMFLPEIW
jgi:hypothetical protein